MGLNVENLKKLMETNYNNNYNEFARQTGVDVGLLYRIMTGKANAGLKTVNILIDFLKKNNYPVNEYIFLP